jgi:hypothetical protein
MKMIFALRDEKGAPHVYRIDTAVSQKAVEDLPIEWSDMFDRTVLAIAVLRWFGIEYNPDGGSENVINFRNIVNQMRDPNGWTISDDFRQWHAPDLVTPAPEVETGDWQGMDTARCQDEPEGRDIIDNDETNAAKLRSHTRRNSAG